MWWLYSLRKFEFEWNFEALPLNAVKTFKGKINDGVAFSLVIGIDAAELGGHLAVSHGAYAMGRCSTTVIAIAPRG
jgi:hypothetical protein